MQYFFEVSARYVFVYEVTLVLFEVNSSYLEIYMVGLITCFSFFRF